MKRLREWPLRVVLRWTRRLLSRPGNDFSWSWWDSADEAIAEIDRLEAARESDQLKVLFLPLAGLHDVAQFSGWGRSVVVVEGLLRLRGVDRQVGARLSAGTTPAFRDLRFRGAR